jgi:hypothetical protein
MLAVHIDSLVFLLLVGAAALMRFLASKANRPSEDDETPPPGRETPPPLARPDPQTDEERIRKFLEALGQPTSSKPPPAVKPRALPQFQQPEAQNAERSARRRTVINPLPPLTTVPPEVPRRVTLPRAMPAPQQSKSVKPPATVETTVFEVEQGAVAPASAAPARTMADLVEAFNIASQPTPIVRPKSDVVSLLKTPEGLRQAIILREIFGPPRSLQPLES